MTSYRNKLLPVLIILVLFVLLGGCVSLSDDITPPPDRPTSRPTTMVEVEPSPTPVVESGQSPSPTPGEEESSQPETTVEEYQGTVSVKIDNQAEDQTLEGEIQIRLEGYDHMDPVYDQTIPTDDGGDVTFENVPFKPGRLFFASVSYRGAVYRSDITELEPDAETLELTVEVFGTTTDHSALQIERLHVFVDFPQPEVAQFAEIFIVSNFGQQTVVAEEEGGPVLRFSLPSGAENLRFESGEIGDRFLVTEEGFGDTVSIPPGSGVYQLLVFYDLPYQNQKLQFQQEMTLPVGAAVVMTPASGVSLKGENFQDMGLREVQNGSIHVYAGQQVEQGEMLAFSLSGDPQKPTGAETGVSLFDRQNLIIGLGVFGIVLTAAGVWFYIRLQREEDIDLTFERDDIDKEEIMDAIIALDDRFEEGEIAEKAYRERRKELKSRLEKLVRHEGDQ